MVSTKHVVAVDRLKVVVRRLPPHLPEDVFWESVKPWVTSDNTIWRLFVKGKASQRSARESVPSRAYVTFKTHDAVAAFSRDFEGHLYRDKQGNETRAIVEFAPFQKIPPADAKADSKYMGTIENDSYYIQFVKSLGSIKKLSESDTLENFMHATSELKDAIKTTPLLEALKAEKDKAKEAALARRHALAQQEKENKKSSKIAPAAGSSSTREDKPSRSAKRKAAAKEKEKAGTTVVPKIIMKNATATPSVDARSDAGTVASTASTAPTPPTPKPESKPRQPKGGATKNAPLDDPSAENLTSRSERKRGAPPSTRSFELALNGVAQPRRERKGGPGSAVPKSASSTTVAPGVLAVDSGSTGHSSSPSERGGGRGNRGRGRGRGAPPQAG